MFTSNPFLASFFTVILYGGVHSLLASSSAKTWVRNQYGARVDRFYRLAFNLFAAVSFLPVLLTIAIWPGEAVYSWSGLWRIIPLTLQPTLLILFIVAGLQSQPLSFTGLRQLADGQEEGGLRTTGAYGIVRHPLYTLGLCMLWLIPVMTVGLLGFACGLTLYILIGSTLEERRLVAEFGDEYRQYQKRVRKLIPFLY
jgi:methanethiol S-methyltransferase